MLVTESHQRTAKGTDLALATGHGDVDEAAGVSEPLLRAALGGLLLLLGLNLLSNASASVLYHQYPAHVVHAS
jgi:hypothetical protein